MQFKEYKHDTAITDDTELVDAVPPGYMVLDMTFVESAGHAATIDCGSASAGEDIFEQQTIAASGITTIVVNKVISMSERKSLFINDDGAGVWGGASLVVFVTMKRVML